MLERLGMFEEEVNAVTDAEGDALEAQFHRAIACCILSNRFARRPG